jgi:hypothetical protein
MKLAVDVNEVVLSNVGATGEFRIRNSAKAFKILSDGLYSNKIRAIIRELSCNALDSHVGAGKANVPFEVHLPTVLEPWFAVKDFGLGLSGDHVVNIYTTYFESTKTDSNAFIGALGLGSKSPFSYTENFTVTAIKDGIKRIYSAFINEAGVPSISEMATELTDEGNGVEVKFSVINRGDYQSFRNEARGVFAWFEHKPDITGVDNFEHKDLDYLEKNIVPGVHTRKSDDYYNRHSSVALMGNIPYPLNNIPDAPKHLGHLAGLLECGLVLEFEIGDLDFAASREQLSYVPLTLNSIKQKLELLNSNLASHLAAKADVIQNEWERAFYLYTEHRNKLYKAAVEKYVADTKFELFNHNDYQGVKVFDLVTGTMLSRGLEIKGFRVNNDSSSRINEHTSYVKNAAGITEYVKSIQISVGESVVIVLNDLKTGCQSRARYHFNKIRKNKTVFCISHNSTDLVERQAEYDKLLKELHNPPVVIKASLLDKQIREKPVSRQGILDIRLKSGKRPGYMDAYTWESHNTELADDQTYYYVTLNNHEPFGKDGKSIDVFAIKALMDSCGVAGIRDIRILGVRKNRIKEIQDLDNWVWFEDKLREETAKISDQYIEQLVATELLDQYNNRLYTSTEVAKLLDVNSDYAKYVAKYGAKKRTGAKASELSNLCGMYGKSVKVDAVKTKIENDKTEVLKKYPFLKLVRDGHGEVDDKQVADYITMVDKQEKT